MKIEDNRGLGMVSFSSLHYGDVFRYKAQIAVKIHPVHSVHAATVKAISLQDGRHFSSAFDEESILIEPLNDFATLVIK